MLRMQKFIVAACITCGLLSLSTIANADQTSDSIKVIQKVGEKGEGNEAASAAWKVLATSSPEKLSEILTALNTANPLASNWLRAAVDTICSNALENKELPTKELEAFLNKKSNNQYARRLAYEWLTQGDATAEARIIPKMLDDPSLEMRRDAIDQVIAEAKAAAGDAQLELYRKAYKYARDEAQIKETAGELRKAGDKINVAEHFGFIMDWNLIGSFDNADLAGFDVIYPPEKELNFDKTYAGKEGEAKWISAETNDEYGLVDLKKIIGPVKGCVAYATTTFDSEKEQDVQFRIGIITAWKLWVNGELVFARGEYHRGTRMDQYLVPVKLAKGKNVILLKVCQNEQTQSWAQRWQFQIRATDDSGKVVLSTNRPDLPSGPLPKEN